MSLLIPFQLEWKSVDFGTANHRKNQLVCSPLDQGIIKCNDLDLRPDIFSKERVIRFRNMANETMDWWNGIEYVCPLRDRASNIWSDAPNDKVRYLFHPGRSDMVLNAFGASRSVSLRHVGSACEMIEGMTGSLSASSHLYTNKAVKIVM